MFALLRANIVTGCTHRVTSAHGKLRREKHAEERSLLCHGIWAASYLTAALPVACAKVWELHVKAKFTITEKKLLVFGKQDSGNHFLFVLADEENVVGVMFSLPIFFPQEKKMLTSVCTQREENKREQRKWREGATDLENGHLGPEEQGLW